MSSRSCLLWWISQLSHPVGVPLVSPKIDLTTSIFTERGWGAHVGLDIPGHLVRGGVNSLHQHPRVEGSQTGSSVPESSLFFHSDCNGRFNSKLLHKQRVRHQIMINDAGDSPVLQPGDLEELANQSQTHSTQAKCPGRPAKVR